MRFDVTCPARTCANNPPQLQPGPIDDAGTRRISRRWMTCPRCGNRYRLTVTLTDAPHILEDVA